MKLTVTSDLGSFKQGQVLKRDKDAIAYYRAMVDEGADVPTPLDDDAILDCINAIDGDDDDAEEKRVTMIEAGGVQTIVHDVAIHAGSHHIAQAAAKAAAKISAATFAEVEEYIRAKGIVKRGPAVVAHGLSQDFTPDEIEAMPVPGSQEKDTNNPDRFSDTVGDKKIPASYYSKLFDTSALGAPILLELNEIDKANKAIPDADAKPIYKRMTKSERTAERARVSQRRTDGRGNLIIAIKLLKKMASVNRMTNCGARFFFEDAKAEKKVIKNSPACMVVFDKHEPANATAITVGAFNALKPDTISKEALLADLLETSSKGADDKSKTKQDAASYNLDVMVGNVGLMSGYTQKIEADDKLTAAFYAKLQASDDFCINTFRLAAFLETVTSRKELARRNAKLETDLLETGTTKKVA